MCEMVVSFFFLSSCAIHESYECVHMNEPLDVIQSDGREARRCCARVWLGLIVHQYTGKRAVYLSSSIHSTKKGHAEQLNSTNTHSNNNTSNSQYSCEIASFSDAIRLGLYFSVVSVSIYFYKTVLKSPKL